MFHFQEYCSNLDDYCPKFDQDLPERNKQKARVLTLHHKEWLGYKVFILDVIGISIELKEGAKPTALDLNMGCYTIRLDPQAVEMFTIIFPWGK